MTPTMTNSSNATDQTSVLVSVAWVHQQSNKILCVRTQGQDRFFIPGGKPEQGESLPEALVREVHEELGVRLRPETIQPLTVIQGPAYGRPHCTLLMHCFVAEPETVDFSAHAEIAELVWVDQHNKSLCAPAAIQLIDELAMFDTHNSDSIF
ncbi:hypothetical protein BFW38_07925 [Terasakiispira papahanaumokuakeensis]|uniref:Nudix hydrolase domain-containing protein n=2 Tax=Terasakiispira papahanaumokuakeensis TaxID=197479 RepID=A0A1E2V984_9GAMM|nr:hypothetical protein BFW38_07925 [Terasakiispira papahanaumokuakeensis]